MMRKQGTHRIIKKEFCVAILSELSYNICSFERDVPGFGCTSAKLQQQSASGASSKEAKNVLRLSIDLSSVLRCCGLDHPRKAQSLYGIILWREGLNPFQPSPLLKFSTGTGKIISCRKQSLSHLPAFVSCFNEKLNKESFSE